MIQPAQKRFSLIQLWREIPLVARIMLIGLTMVTILVISGFAVLLGGPGALVRDENFYIHLALLFLVPGALAGLIGVSFGYAYYQLCKRYKQSPFWAAFIRDMK